MDDTPNLKLPYIMAAQAQKHVTHNEAIRALDAVVQLTVIDRDLSTPPASPGDGGRHIVASGATGAWAGKDGQIAAWQDNAWMFYAPLEGWIAWIADEDKLVAWDGAAWADAALDSVNPVPLAGVNATADTTNRLAVSSPASLFNHEGAGHQHKINKNTAGDTASVLFQTGFSGRAEFGLAGDDDFHIKVSPNGTNWSEAVVIDGDTGEVSTSLLRCTAPAADQTPLTIEAAPDQTASIFQVKAPSGTTAFYARSYDGMLHCPAGLNVTGGLYVGFMSPTGNIALRNPSANIIVGSASELDFRDAEYATAGNVSSVIQFDAVGELGMRNAGTPQKLNIYETTDSALADYSRGYLKATASGAFEIGTEAAGAGTRRGLKLNSANRAAKINDPGGGTTVDNEARAAINAIIDVLESFGLSAAS